MSGFLKWTESQLDKFDTIASKALNIKEDSVESPIYELELHNNKLQEDIRTLKSIASTQLKDSQEKYQAHVDLLKNSIQSMENSLKELTEENMLLKEHLRNADLKLTRITKVNEELSMNMEKEIDVVEDNNSVEEFQYQVNLLSEKVKRQAALLKAEKLKTIDAIREKNDVLRLSGLEKKAFEGKIQILVEELRKEREGVLVLKEQLECKPKLSISADSQNLAALSDHLQAKQRTIELLINEKSSLVLLLENEKNEKYKLMESKLNNRVVRQSLGSLNIFQYKRWIRRVAEWFDEGLREFTDLLEEIALARLAIILYLLVVHSGILYWILATPSSQDFLTNA